MALTNTEYGKAYEYACLTALKEHVALSMFSWFHCRRQFMHRLSLGEKRIHD